MLKLCISVLLALAFLVPSAHAQQAWQDVIYLKDGSVIRGTIIEQIPNFSVKIQTKEGNVFVHKMQDITKIAKERAIGYQWTSAQGKKSPALAFMLSFLIPGVGQYYNGDVAKGAIQEVAVVTGIALALTAGIQEKEYRYEHYYPERRTSYYYLDEETTWFYVGLGLAGAATVWSWIDAPIAAKKINSQRKLAYGHLLEFDSKDYVLGFDLVKNRAAVGAKLSLHF